jgi:VanZ family protein
MLLSQFVLGDKMIHFIAYAVVALVPALGLRLSIAARCVVATELTGISLEFAQTFVDGRSCDIYDIVANTLGALTGIVLAMMLRTRFVKYREALPQHGTERRHDS